MSEWWASLTVAEQVFAYLAIPATVVLVAQVLLTLLGLWGDGDTPDGDAAEGLDLDDVPELDDVAELEDTPDFDEEDDPGEDGSFRLLTVRGIVAFLAVGGWTGLSMLRSGCTLWWAIPVSFAAGGAAMVLMAAALYALLRLQSSGTLDYRNAVGQEGEVYLTVPPAGGGSGKIQVVIQGALRECQAQQEGRASLPTGTPVIVTGLKEGGVLIVQEKA